MVPWPEIWDPSCKEVEVVLPREVLTGCWTKTSEATEELSRLSCSWCSWFCSVLGGISLYGGNAFTSKQTVPFQRQRIHRPHSVIRNWWHKKGAVCCWTMLQTGPSWVVPTSKISEDSRAYWPFCLQYFVRARQIVDDHIEFAWYVSGFQNDFSGHTRTGCPRLPCKAMVNGSPLPFQVRTNCRVVGRYHNTTASYLMRPVLNCRETAFISRLLIWSRLSSSDHSPCSSRLNGFMWAPTPPPPSPRDWHLWIFENPAGVLAKELPLSKCFGSSTQNFRSSWILWSRLSSWGHHLARR